MQDQKPLKLTLEDGQKAAGAHALEKGYQLNQKYGNFIDLSILSKILEDDEFVRYPTRIEFDSEKIEEGMFGVEERISADASDGYVIYIHEHFKQRQGDLPALVLYHIVTVNYGDFATYNEAEEFASAALAMDKDYYYNYICRLVDSIPRKES